MEQLNTLLDQLQTYALRDDLVPCGKEINDLKISFEDTLLEMERVNQIQMLEAREDGKITFLNG